MSDAPKLGDISVRRIGRKVILVFDLDKLSDAEEAFEGFMRRLGTIENIRLNGEESAVN